MELIALIALLAQPADAALLISVETYDTLPAPDHASADVALIERALPAARIVRARDAVESIEAGVRALEQQPPPGRIWLYAVGHGETGADGRTRLIARDGRRIDLMTLVARLEATTAREVIALFETCRFGPPGVALPPPPAPSRALIWWATLQGRGARARPSGAADAFTHAISRVLRAGPARLKPAAIAVRHAVRDAFAHDPELWQRPTLQLGRGWHAEASLTQEAAR